MTQIRRYSPEDVPAIKKLIQGVMQSEFKEDSAVFPIEDLDALLDARGVLGEAFFVAEDKKRIVGTVGVKREDERVAFLRRIFVDPQYRKRKIGLELLNRAIEFCGEVGYHELIFKTTSRMTDAIDLVRKRGFQSRAKVPMGRIELMKFSLPLKNHRTAKQS